MENSALLPPRLEAVREIMLSANRIGMTATNALVDAGLGEWSSNAAIASLDYLVSEGPSRPRELLSVSRLTRGGLSNLLDRLESAGLITRSYGTVPGDRRGAIVTITAAGTAAMSAINSTITRSLGSQRSELELLAAALESVAGEPDLHSSDATGASVSQVRRLAMAGTAMSMALGDVDDPMPVATAVALGTVARADHTRPRDLIEQTGLSSSAVSQLLDRLENCKLIRRRVGRPPDRRAVIVELTDHGRERLEQRLSGVADHIELLRAAWDELPS